MTRKKHHEQGVHDTTKSKAAKSTVFKRISSLIHTSCFVIEGKKKK